MDKETSSTGVERDRLQFDLVKLKIESKHNRTVLWVGAFLSVFGALTPTLLTYFQNAERLRLDAQKQEDEQKQKADDLNMKRSEIERARDATRTQFLQQHIDLIMSSEPDAQLRLSALVTLILPAEADALNSQIKTIRNGLETQRSPQHENGTPTTAKGQALETADTAPPLIISYAATEVADLRPLGESALSAGRTSVKRGDFEQALEHFSTAVIQDPRDPLAWNFKAYSEFRTNRLTAALTSIHEAWKLNPTENQTRRWVTINATKILCAQGRSTEAATFFNQSASAVPEIITDVYDDLEFKKTCKFIWRG
ncbi:MULTISPECIES: tetratricopeptide repeat protein [Pseudomonas]|uniref:tetratricopeptide repeat protein n=1 Tax=Pseudomonas TaxID=286 RepID=UPI0009316980|nr:MULTISPECIES: tetratricopeptide repeat protein [Pseudomonas]NHN68206.1 tetratricopeptide repeat protein [Pseudomonas fluorescens]